MTGSSLLILTTKKSFDKREPDIIIWSRMSRRVLLFELTCPAEEGIQVAQIKKVTRYLDLLQNIRDAHWSPELFTVEVGARGPGWWFYLQSFCETRVSCVSSKLTLQNSLGCRSSLLLRNLLSPQQSHLVPQHRPRHWQLLC